MLFYLSWVQLVLLRSAGSDVTLQPPPPTMDFLERCLDYSCPELLSDAECVLLPLLYSLLFPLDLELLLTDDNGLLHWLLLLPLEVLLRVRVRPGSWS